MQRLSQITALNVGYATHEGMTGKHNEDSFGLFAWKLDEERVLHLGVVADGVGGQIAGEIASRLAVDTLRDYFDRQERVNNVSGHLEQAIRAANEAVYHASQQQPEYRGMSTTIAVAAFSDGRLFTAHVGDSRIYLLRDGRLRQISTDHTWAQEAIEAGLLTREQARTHPNRNVIKRHLGGKLEIEVDHRLVLEPGRSAEEAHANQGLALQPGDTLLICSDGLTDMISDEAVRASLQADDGDLPRAAAELIDKANQAGGRDNITAILLQVLPEGAVAAVEQPTTLVVPARSPAAATVPGVAMQPAVPARRKSSVPLLLAGGGLLGLLLALAAGAVFLFVRSRRETPTPTPSMAPVIEPGKATATAPPGAPATAAILATAGRETATAEGAAPIDTPGLVPTLRPTSTPTRQPVPPPPGATATALATVAPAASDTPTRPPVPPPPGATATSPPPQPSATTAPQPTNTPVPTDTPAPSPTVPPAATIGAEPSTVPRGQAMGIGVEDGRLVPGGSAFNPAEPV